ncbi:MAG: DUF3089 domain-containing protein, partial [Candidatus Dadabacteria bacterium]
MRQLLLALLLTSLSACHWTRDDSDAKDGATAATPAAQLALASLYAPLDYSDPDLWGCNGASGDLCHHEWPTIERATDGTTTVTVREPAAEPAFDCFYIYPTVDLRFGEVTNHTDLTDLELPRRTIEAQAAPFVTQCRVFAPFYRQATIGSYGGEDETAVDVFRSAFADVAAAFEYYLAHWNQGRPLVIMGHSQGAQHATYLLHRYFDQPGDVEVVPGTTTTALRERLILALPIGFRVFTPAGQDRGGSLQQIPLCTKDDQFGCVIHYRSYAEGYRFSPANEVGDFYVDRVLAAEGLLFRSYSAATDVVACVNPATRPADGRPFADIDGDPVDPERILSVALFQGAIAGVGGFDDAFARGFRDYYSATCRSVDDVGDVLMVGRAACLTDQQCGTDPVPIDGFLAQGALGLHLWDYNIAMGDLLEQVRRRAAAWF